MATGVSESPCLVGVSCLVVFLSGGRTGASASADACWYKMDLHDPGAGARQRAGTLSDIYALRHSPGPHGTTVASRERAPVSPGAPTVLMSTPAASQQHHGEGGEALLRPPASHTGVHDGAGMLHTEVA